MSKATFLYFSELIRNAIDNLNMTHLIFLALALWFVEIAKATGYVEISLFQSRGCNPNSQYQGVLLTKTTNPHCAKFPIDVGSYRYEVKDNSWGEYGVEMCTVGCYGRGRCDWVFPASQATGRCITVQGGVWLQWYNIINAADGERRAISNETEEAVPESQEDSQEESQEEELPESQGQALQSRQYTSNGLNPNSDTTWGRYIVGSSKYTIIRVLFYEAAANAAAITGAQINAIRDYLERNYIQDDESHSGQVQGAHFWYENPITWQNLFHSDFVTGFMNDLRRGLGTWGDRVDRIVVTFGEIGSAGEQEWEFSV